MADSHDLLMGTGVAAAVLSLVGVAELWRRLGQPDPEWTRKLVHIGGGMISLTLPLAIGSPWTALALALAMAALFSLSRLCGLLPSLHGVCRGGQGAVYFPLAIWLLFCLTRDDLRLYVICVLVLALGDAVAALVGRRYGATRYRVGAAEKSLEGSLAFFVLAFLIIHLVLVLWQEPPAASAPASVLAALLAALVATAVEAACRNGLDNLIVPLALFAVLRQALSLSPQSLAAECAAMVVIAAAAASLPPRRGALDVGDRIALALCIYAAWLWRSAPETVMIAAAVGACLVAPRAFSRRVTAAPIG